MRRRPEPPCAALSPGELPPPSIHTIARVQPSLISSECLPSLAYIQNTEGKSESTVQTKKTMSYINCRSSSIPYTNHWTHIGWPRCVLYDTRSKLQGVFQIREFTPLHLPTKTHVLRGLIVPSPSAFQQFVKVPPTSVGHVRRTCPLAKLQNSLCLLQHCRSAPACGHPRKISSEPKRFPQLQISPSRDPIEKKTLSFITFQFEICLLCNFLIRTQFLMHNMSF